MIFRDRQLICPADKKLFLLIALRPYRLTTINISLSSTFFFFHVNALLFFRRSLTLLSLKRGGGGRVKKNWFINHAFIPSARAAEGAA